MRGTRRSGRRGGRRRRSPRCSSGTGRRHPSERFGAERCGTKQPNTATSPGSQFQQHAGRFVHCSVGACGSRRPRGERQPCGDLPGIPPSPRFSFPHGSMATVSGAVRSATAGMRAALPDDILRIGQVHDVAAAAVCQLPAPRFRGEDESGTPPGMSPEQAGSSGLDVGTTGNGGAGLGRSGFNGPPTPFGGPSFTIENVGRTQPCDRRRRHRRWWWRTTPPRATTCSASSSYPGQPTRHLKTNTPPHRVWGRV